MVEFLKNNSCGAKNSRDLLRDNFSCKCIEDLREAMSKHTKNQIGGFLSSLQEKNVLVLEDRSGESDLYWVNDSWLKENISLSW